MKFLKQISKCFSRAILLENGFIFPEGNKDVIKIGEFESSIEVDTDFTVNVDKISIEHEDEESLLIAVVYTGIFREEKVFTADYKIKTNKDKCFWQSDVKGTVTEHQKVKFVKVTQMESWANERFCKHFAETGHGRQINNKDTL